MAIEIRVPPLGESVVEATVGRWTKGEGDSVAKDEILVELETDKITVEVAAQSAGVLGKIEKQEGDTVGVNELLAHLEEGAAGGNGSSAPEGPAAAPSAEPVGQPGGPKGEGDAASAADGGQTSPAVRAIAAEHGLDLAIPPWKWPQRPDHQGGRAEGRRSEERRRLTLACRRRRARRGTEGPERWCTVRSGSGSVRPAWRARNA